MAQPPRPYRSSVRTRQAESTRKSILAAAGQLFARAGYQGTTIENIASAAGVSVPTVYLAFRSKPGILSTLVATAVVDPEILELAAAAERELDPESRLRKAAHVMRLALESEAELTGVLWEAGSGSTELLEAWRQMHSNRHARLRAVLAPLLPSGRRERAAAEKFLDVVWALSSPEMYRLLVAERGWSPQKFEHWLADSILALRGEVTSGLS